MLFNARNLVAWLALLALAGATVWALSFSPDPPADFTFGNEAEVKSVDPAVITGQLEGRIVDCLFEGLTRWDPETLEPKPGVAESWEISADKRTYTFHLRHDAKWSDGTPFTAADFLWSHRRALDPQTGCDYSYIYWTIKNARKYNTLRVEVGDPVEIELNESEPGAAEFARGKVLRGKLVSVDPKFPEEQTTDEDDAPKRTYVVEIAGRRRTFQPGDGENGCKFVLLDFSEVGLRAVDPFTYQITLENPTAYFLQVTGMFPLYPVQQRCVEAFGYPGWVTPEHIISNGPFRLAGRKIRERMRLAKSDTYWGRNEVKLNTIDALVIESRTTALNLYLTGKVDWIPAPPPAIAKQLLDEKRDDFHPLPEFTIVFYRLNVKRPPLDNKLVRQALNLAMNKQAIVDGVTRAGEVAARSIVPPVIRKYANYANYEPGQCGAYNPKEAARLLAEAGYPASAGMEKIPLLSNTDEGRKMVAELIQREWKESLGINIGLQNQEWHAYLNSSRKGDYSIAVAGWIGDYIDPMTFLGMFVTGGADNQTGWSNAKYDELIADAAKQQDDQKRLKMFHDAEQILMDELPVIPVYVQVTRNMVRPYVHGFFENALDTHPLGRVWVDAEARNRLHAEGGTLIWFIVKRLLWMVLTIWVVFTVSFLLMHAAPGGPFDSQRKLAPEIQANIEHRYHLDEPLLQQYFRELTRDLHGDLGYSFKLGDFTVNQIIAAGLPRSATLGILALAFAITLGFSAGVVSAVRRGGPLDFTLMSLATIGIALPSFVIAGMAIIVFVFVWPILPAAGFGSLRQAILPSLCLGAPFAAEIARLVRTGMLDVLGQDYIRTAYAKGLPTRTVILRHAMKGAVLPLVSYLGPTIVDVLTGSTIIEQIFAIPGLGYHFVQSALDLDYTLAMGIVLFYTVLLCMINLVVDIAYTVLDPRVKLE